MTGEVVQKQYSKLNMGVDVIYRAKFRASLPYVTTEGMGMAGSVPLFGASRVRSHARDAPLVQLDFFSSQFGCKIAKKS